ncbi:sensor histidine kinase [Xylanibacter ruminicola]|uniref:histidine kinase n=1 Tax=Xylanibacter ruminicola TaxID=839 RepID=A0A1M6TUY6_XYLRU|nr:HAMP domain-containing sensor histidine kinase [Xylanibacter ruminicola]SHK60608.1 His Kinase A (phospho-acceptor) domain-containing protein [Xylanibacter ruminicola]
MTGLRNTQILIALLAMLAIAGCKKHEHSESAGIYEYYETDGFNRADSIIDKISDTREYDYMLFAIDSLNNIGELSKTKYLFYRTITLNLINQQLQSLKLYYQLDTLDLKQIKTQTDIESYVYTYNNYVRMLSEMRRFDRALREANKADKRLKSIGYTTFTEHHDIAQIIGECQLYMGEEDSAAISFQKSLAGIYKRLEHHNGPLDLRECQKTMNAIAKAYIHKEMFDKVESWITIQDTLYNMAARDSRRDSVYLDEMSAEINYSKALLAIKQGKKKEAEQAYELYKQTNTAKLLYNVVNNNEYLMFAGRYAEAARNFERLDEFLLGNGYKCDLENIGRYMIPKYRANMLAGRRDSAIHVANVVAENYNRALTDQKKNDADLLTMVYDTEGKERQIAEKEAEISKQRLVAVVIGLIVLTLFFHIYGMMRRRAYRKLDATNKQLKLANERAEESSRIKSKFIKQISHEVRTPLNVLSGFSQVLAYTDIEIDKEELKSIRKKIVENTERITQLVDKMLDLSMVNSEADIECHDKMTPLDMAYKAIEQSGINHASHLVLELQHEPEAQTTKILTNQKAAVKTLALLLDNAKKFTHPLAYKGSIVPEGKARVTMTIAIGHKQMRFTIEDTGIGIPAEQAENIFTEFVQIDEYTDGAGLGLSIARSLARHMGGDVQLDTSYTDGARFVVTLPLRK